MQNDFDKSREQHRADMRRQQEQRLKEASEQLAREKQRQRQALQEQTQQFTQRLRADTEKSRLRAMAKIQNAVPQQVGAVGYAASSTNAGVCDAGDLRSRGP
jgi:hypothetical protein